LTPAVLLLTDGAAALAAVAEALRTAGFRVIATPLPQEFERRFRDDEVVLAAAPPRLLTPRMVGALARRRIEPGPRPELLALLGDAETAPDVADETASADDPRAVVAAAMRAASERGRGADLAPTAGSAAPVPRFEPTPNLPAAAVFPENRLAEIARRLSESEADTDRLLDAALDAFLEVADARCGSLLLAPEDGRLEVVRRSGYRPEDGDPARVEASAAEAAARGVAVRGRLADDVDFLAAPLTSGASVLGVLVAVVKPGAPATPAAAETVARQAAANYSNARQLAELRQAAVIDPLTGLFNRRFFDRQLRLEIERARRHRRQVTLAIIDVDSFKRFNGFNGYDVGDQVIRETASLLRTNFREIDVVTRWGGDEFAVILPETGRRGDEHDGPIAAAHFVDRVRKAVELHAFAACPGGKVTVSAGVAGYPADAADARALFQLANQALIQAKRGGNNRVCIVGPEGLITNAFGS
jgi:diguanylate cyclase (GGDEF)-like protein